MSADFLFSFLLFFQVQMDSIRQSGFYQLLEEKYPQMSQGINALESDEEMQEFLNLTGLKFNDFQSFNLTLEGLEGISKVQELGRAPKLGSEIDLMIRAKVKGKLNQEELISFMLDELEKEKGKTERQRVEKTKLTEGNITFMTIPAEVMGDETSASDFLFAISQEKNHSELMVGIPKKVKDALAGKSTDAPLACLDSMAKDRQVTLAIKVDPAIWERPEFGANQQNPLLAGLANSVKGIREVGISISFLEKSLGLEVCVSCKDEQSALGLWTVAQGGLGMAQLAMAQEGGQAPAILNRVKTQAVEKNVFVRVEVIPSDLDEFAGKFLPNANNSPTLIPAHEHGSAEQKSGSKLLTGKAAPGFEASLLNGKKFNIAEQKGKVVILDFWATWCGPCVRGLPILQEVTSSFDNKKVRFVAVNQGENKKTINQFLKSKNLTKLTVALDKTSAVGNSYKVKGIPQTVVIDQEGIVRFVHVGFSSSTGKQLEKEIKELLSKE